MQKKQKALLSIGEFAALHHINKKTLMWYDEVDLLKPAVVGENGYRYYTFHQSAELDTILVLREMDVPIPDIRAFMRDRSAPALEAMLDAAIGEADRTIRRMETIRGRLTARRAEVRTLMETNLEAIRLVEEPAPRWLAEAPTTDATTFEQGVAHILEMAAKHRVARVHDTAYGLILPVEHLYAGRFEKYTALFVEIPEPSDLTGLHLRPAGTYLRAFCQGNWEKLPERYRDILTYAETHGLELLGCAYEVGIGGLFVETLDDCITRIEIPVRTGAKR